MDNVKSQWHKAQQTMLYTMDDQSHQTLNPFSSATHSSHLSLRLGRFLHSFAQLGHLPTQTSPTSAQKPHELSRTDEKRCCPSQRTEVPMKSHEVSFATGEWHGGSIGPPAW